MPNPGHRETPLTPEDIVEMRTLRATSKKATLSYLGWLFETTTANVHLIVTGQTHKEVGGPITGTRPPTDAEQVEEIRKLRVNHRWSYRLLSSEFGKSEVALRSICSGKSFPQYGGPLTGGGYGNS